MATEQRQRAAAECCNVAMNTRRTNVNAVTIRDCYGERNVIEHDDWIIVIIITIRTS